MKYKNTVKTIMIFFSIAAIVHVVLAITKSIITNNLFYINPFNIVGLNLLFPSLENQFLIGSILFVVFFVSIFIFVSKKHEK